MAFNFNGIPAAEVTIDGGAGYNPVPATNQTYVMGNADIVSNTTTVLYTVGAGKTLYVTDIFLSGHSSSTWSAICDFISDGVTQLKNLAYTTVGIGFNYSSIKTPLIVLTTKNFSLVTTGYADGVRVCWRGVLIDN